MPVRVWTVALNTYREAVRARILHGLFVLALATLAYSLVVGQYTSRNALRVVSDLGAAAISLYAVVVAVVLGATSLYRELELKTLFPILARPISRTEYLVGKYLGMLLLLAVFVSASTGISLLAVAAIARQSSTAPVLVGVGSAIALGLIGYWARRSLTYLPIAWSVLLFGVGLVLASGAPDDRRVLVGLGLLTVCEVAIIAGIATLFSAFSSPFLTAVFTLSLFLVGRSAEELARLPVKVFGAFIKSAGVALSKIVPNLMLYVPPRPLLTGESGDVQLWSYVAQAALHALAWSVLLLAVASQIFRRRDFI